MAAGTPSLVAVPRLRGGRLFEMPIHSASQTRVNALMMIGS
jgi:hypothetical protein